MDINATKDNNSKSAKYTVYTIPAESKTEAPRDPSSHRRHSRHNTVDEDSLVENSQAMSLSTPMQRPRTRAEPSSAPSDANSITLAVSENFNNSNTTSPRTIIE